ncbi:MAG: tRNA pseudouridine(38-40) synthase TruA [Candidatus Omnitrophica bacterium]|nr:tRNA pseudouridine(38-40) synthase TruA [Candidatus Omnitrophota bacterium]
MSHIIKLTIAYDGTNYNGWQRQKNGPSIQEEIEKSVEKVFKKRVTIYGAGRTDAGVHAKKQVAHFNTDLAIPAKKVVYALNSVLPPDISVIKAEYAKAGFHAQYDAKQKTYRYFIHASRSRDPFISRYAWTVPYRLDLEAMKAGAKALAGKHDFRSFQAKDKKDRSSVRTVYGISIKKKSSVISIDITADGFLYNMVRNIVGTLVDVARGYIPADRMKKIILAEDRAKAGPTAPPEGLFLMEVSYR